MLHAYLIFTALGPILTVATGDQIDRSRLRALLRRKGIVKVIAFEVPLGTVQAAYREPFEIIAEGLDPERPEIRVLEIDGQDIFDRIPFSDLGDPVLIEE